MRPACEMVIKFVLPAFRSTVARSLINDYDRTQIETAKLLGTTQAAVSYYMSERRGGKIRIFERNELVRHAATEVAKGLASGDMTSKEATFNFCQLCTKLRSTKEFCNLHRGIEMVDEQCNICPQSICP